MATIKICDICGEKIAIPDYYILNIGKSENTRSLNMDSNIIKREMCSRCTLRIRTFVEGIEHEKEVDPKDRVLYKNIIADI